MKEKKIRLKAASDVKEFVSAAEKCDFEIDVWNGSIVVDAKSFLGVVSQGFQQDMTVQYMGNNPQFETVLNKYSVS